MTTIKFTKSSCQTVNIDNAVDGIQMTRKKVQNNKTFFYKKESSSQLIMLAFKKQEAKNMRFFVQRNM